jgi:hypothetical protein
MDDKIIPFDPKKQKKSSVKSLTFTPPDQTNIEHREMEKLAEQVAMHFHSYDRSLGKLRSQIERIHDYFTTSVRGSVTLAGCGSFGEYCTKKLGRTRQAVYSMLGAYPERARERKQREPKRERERDDDLPLEAQMRLRTSWNSIRRAAEATTPEERDEAIDECRKIIAAEPLKSVLDGDQPNYKVLLVDVLAAGNKLEEAALQMHAVLMNIVESRLLPERTALLASVRVALTGAEELLVAGKQLAAVRRRLNIDPADGRASWNIPLQC